MPSKIESRRDARVRNDYFSRVANSTANVNAIDSLLGAMGDNLGYSKAEDFIDAVNFVVTKKDVFASAEKLAHKKMAEVNSEVSIVSKTAQFETAFEDMNSDGIYKVCGTM